MPNGGHHRRGWRQSFQPDRFRTTDVRPSALNA